MTTVSEMEVDDMDAVDAAEDGEVDTGVCDYPTAVWIDPGTTTGWSVFSVHPHALSDPDTPVLPNVTYWEQGQFAGAEQDVTAACVDLADAWPEAAVGAEDFILRRFGMDRAGLSPVRINAVLTYHLTRGGRRLWLQQPSMAKTAVTDDRLKNWGFYRREGGEEHARDATRHALTWLRRAAAQDRRGARLRAAAWPLHYVSAGLHVGAYLGDFDEDSPCVAGECRCATPIRAQERA